MGNTKSEFFEDERAVSDDPWWREQPQRRDQREQKEEAAKKEEATTFVDPVISEWRRKRSEIIGAKKREMEELRRQLEESRSENEQLRRCLAESPPSSSSEDATRQLQAQLGLAREKVDAFEEERKEYRTHVTSLKEIIALSKQLLLLRDTQIKELNGKVEEIEAALAQTKARDASEDLRAEYEKQLKNMKQLRAMYEERQRLDQKERANLQRNLDDAAKTAEKRELKIGELKARVEELEVENWERRDKVAHLESQLALSEAGCRDLQTELAVINKLFTRVLVGFGKGEEIDLDKLVETLEENHDLLTDIVVNEDCQEVSSALPKVLLDLIDRVNTISCPDTSQAVDDVEKDTASPSSATLLGKRSGGAAFLNEPTHIVENLPKVWRVLTELLSHQNGSASVAVPENCDDSSSSSITPSASNPCYKSVQTPTGPALVLSVSKTFIRLKDLIVEKKSLEKETLRLKQLNTHLESRLQDQEKRLGVVSQELSKTWHVVEKMQKQHAQLHTQEKILRYELAQKRKLLNELKEELEYCREKWLQAREKNSHTEQQWKQLRSEFVARKSVEAPAGGGGTESGYSDDRDSSSSGGSDHEEASCQSPPAEAAIFEVVREEIVKIEHGEEEPSVEENSFDRVLKAREKRLSRLEEQAQHLVTRTALTSSRGARMSERLDDLHEKYGQTHERGQTDVDKIYKNLEDDIIQTIRKTQSGEMAGLDTCRRRGATKEEDSEVGEGSATPSTSSARDSPL